jgi:hypothetical protein
MSEQLITLVVISLTLSPHFEKRAASQLSPSVEFIIYFSYVHAKWHKISVIFWAKTNILRKEEKSVIDISLIYGDLFATLVSLFGCGTL